MQSCKWLLWFSTWHQIFQKMEQTLYKDNYLANFLPSSAPLPTKCSPLPQMSTVIFLKCSRITSWSLYILSEVQIGLQLISCPLMFMLHISCICKDMVFHSFLHHIFQTYFICTFLGNTFFFFFFLTKNQDVSLMLSIVRISMLSISWKSSLF